MRQRILVVAKDMALRGRLARALKSRGYGVELAESVAHARRIGLKGFALSLVVPDGLGSEAKTLFGELETNSANPVMIGANEISDDADLLARVAGALRPVPEAESSEPVLRFDRYRFDSAGYALTDTTGLEIPLTRSEFSLLREFVRRPGRVLSRDQLLNSLAGRDAESYDRSIDMSMVRLRRKIEADPKRPSLIVTIPGLGYKFTAKVTEAELAEPVITDSKPEPVAPGPTPPSARERRQLTIVHVALTGPAFIAARRDPEDLQRVLAGFQAHCEAMIAQAGGTIDQLLKDGVLAYFGYPQADEHQAERAIRAALSLSETIGRIDSGQPGRLQVRIGIATGLAVVGGSSALGEAASIATGLALRASPDTILIAASTRRLVGGLFECRAHDPIALDDAAERVEAWEVTGEGAAEGRFEALHGARLSPLVGREEELALLMRRWEQAKSGSGKLVLISGEPGIGKSRLTRAVRDAIAGQPHTELRFFCSPHHQDSALYPHIAQLEHVAAITREDTDEVKLSKLDAVLAQSDVSNEAVALISDLLSIATDQREHIQKMTPQVRRDRTLGALLALLSGLATRQPVLVIYEDVHWIDPSSRELLDRTVEALERLSVLLLMTFRPEFQPPWIGQAHVTSLALSRLDRHDTAAMIAGIAGGNALPEEIAQEIGERTDGVPLFIEEVTKAIIESGPLATEALSSLPHPALAVPATLHASLIARLDRLGPAARDVAQTGAVIGREFRYELIATIADRSEGELRDALERLTSAGLLFGRGTPPEASYLFKHALVQDTAYGSLLRKARQELHFRIAEVLKHRLPGSAEMQPELIAHHYTLARRTEDAVLWWRTAGQRASHLSQNAEATAHLSKALELIATGAEGRERDLLELSVRIELGGPLIGSKGFGSSELEENYARAWALCEKTGATKQSIPVLWGQYLIAGYRAEGGWAISEKKAERFLQLAKQQQDVGLEVVGHRMLGVTRVSRGELASGRQHLEQAIALYDPASHQPLVSAYGINPRVSALVTLGLTLQYLGLPDQASRACGQGVEEAKQSAHFNTLGVALHLAARLCAFRRDGLQLRALASQLIALSLEQGSADWHLAGEILLAWQSAQEGALEEGLGGVSRGVDGLRLRKLNVWLPSYLLMQAEISGAARRCDEALRLLDEALELMELQNHPVCEAELHRLRACIELSRGASLTVVETSFDQALAVARRQNAKFWELRATVSRARFWREHGRYTEAHALLAPLYGWFTEGFGTKDLKEAKALLDELQRQGEPTSA